MGNLFKTEVMKTKYSNGDPNMARDFCKAKGMHPLISSMQYTTIPKEIFLYKNPVLLQSMLKEGLAVVILGYEPIDCGCGWVYYNRANIEKKERLERPVPIDVLERRGEGNVIVYGDKEIMEYIKKIRKEYENEVRENEEKNEEIIKGELATLKKLF